MEIVQPGSILYPKQKYDKKSNYLLVEIMNIAKNIAEAIKLQCL